MKYTAVIEKTDNGYSAYLPDLPGCIAAGDTFEETSQLIREAANYHVEIMAEHGETVPAPTTRLSRWRCPCPARAGKGRLRRAGDWPRRNCQARLKCLTWYWVRTRGSHRHYHHPTKPGTVTIAGRPSKDLAAGTWDRILKQAGIDRENCDEVHSRNRENGQRLLGIPARPAWLHRRRRHLRGNQSTNPRSGQLPRRNNGRAWRDHSGAHQRSHRCGSPTSRPT